LGLNTMLIKKIVILPPLAFARFGSHPEPVASYTLEPPPPDEPLGHRKIKAEPTLIVSNNGEILREDPEPEISFKEKIQKDGDVVHQVRPVAPFFELWGELDDGRFVHLSEKELAGAKVEWCVEVANRKVFRRTRSPDDVVAASTPWFSDHDVHKLKGTSDNLIAGASVKFGFVRYIKPNKKFPHIRLRFTPGAGLIYGTKLTDKDKKLDIPEPFLDDDRDELRIYKSSNSWWQWEHDQGIKEHTEETDKEALKRNDIETVPPSLFAIVPPAPPWLNKDIAVSRGYLDDACDGFVRARLVVNGNTLEARARIGVAPPHYAPNALFVRNLIDDLEQAYAGTDITGNSRERALDIVRRAFETVRYMNVAVMNGNPFKGRDPLDLDTMPAEEAFGTERPLRPVFAPGGADTRTIAALHQRAYTALSSGSGGWFAKLLRQPEECGDLSDEGRRKMPALMCSAESLYLALTRRQMSAINNLDLVDAAEPWPLYPIGAKQLQELRPRNRSAELMYKPLGNPLSSHPIVAISNCCPGLEFDFRAVWRRLLKGITLVEWDNLVVETEAEFDDLKGRRLLKIDDLPVLAEVTGPKPSDPTKPLPLICELYPEGVVSMEWSNSFARVLHKPSRRVTCSFSTEKWGGRRAWPENPIVGENIEVRELEIRNFFEDDSLVVSKDLAEPGELTQGLCSPWQNDFRECSCYYWASARPDYVNVEPGRDGNSFGQNWMQKDRMDPKKPKSDYIADDYRDSRLILYDDLFIAWEKLLEFQVDGRDYEPADKKDDKPGRRGPGNKS
jgi:hypothetical protein